MITRFWNYRPLVERSPLFSLILFEAANVGQIIRMWTTHSSNDQSLTSWVLVNLGIWVSWNFYRVITPEQKFARFTATAGIVVNSVVIATVLFWRYFEK